MQELHQQPIHFSFDELEILGVFEDIVHIKGEIFIQKEEDDFFDFEPAILLFSKNLFHGALDVWLKDKQNYCERWSEYCGVGGKIMSSDYEKVEDIDLLIDFEDDEDGDPIKPIYKLVPAFIINSIDQCTDMEHG